MSVLSIENEEFSRLKDFESLWRVAPPKISGTDDYYLRVLVQEFLESYFRSFTYIGLGAKSKR